MSQPVSRSAAAATPSSRPGCTCCRCSQFHFVRQITALLARCCCTFGLLSPPPAPPHSCHPAPRCRSAPPPSCTPARPGRPTTHCTASQPAPQPANQAGNQATIISDTKSQRLRPGTPLPWLRHTLLQRAAQRRDLSLTDLFPAARPRQTAPSASHPYPALVSPPPAAR